MAPAGSVVPPVTDASATATPVGNGGDPDVCAAAMKAAHAANDDVPDSNSAPAGTPPEAGDVDAAPAPAPELTPEERSDEALVKWKRAYEEFCNEMTDADLKNARVYFMEQRWRRRKQKQAA
jgi:hypothetical protein